MHVYSSSGNRLRAMALIAAIAAAAAIAINAGFDRMEIGPSWLISGPTIGASFVTLYGIFERYAWRWRVLHALGIVDVPVIDGTYEGTLTSTYGSGVALPIRIRIDQDWSRIAVLFEVLTPNSSSSYSICANLEGHGRDQVRLTYTYRNWPRPGIAHRNLYDHDGTAELVIARTSGAVDGRYFTFRGTQGTLSLTKL